MREQTAQAAEAINRVGEAAKATADMVVVSSTEGVVTLPHRGIVYRDSSTEPESVQKIFESLNVGRASRSHKTPSLPEGLGVTPNEPRVTSDEDGELLATCNDAASAGQRPAQHDVHRREPERRGALVPELTCAFSHVRTVNPNALTPKDIEIVGKSLGFRDRAEQEHVLESHDKETGNVLLPPTTRRSTPPEQHLNVNDAHITDHQGGPA